MNDAPARVRPVEGSAPQRCTAPHPARSFLYSAVTTLVVFSVAWLAWAISR